MTTYDNVASSSSTSKVYQSLDLNLLRKSNQSSESNISLDKELNSIFDSRLKTLLDESHAKLIENDGIIKNLQSEILELKFKVRSLESTEFVQYRSFICRWHKKI